MSTLLEKWQITERPGGGKLSIYLPVVLVWSLLFFLPFGRLAELPGFIMLVFAIALMLKKEIIPWQQPYRYFTLAFGFIWIPMLLALPDAFAFEKSLKTTLLYLRFYLAGLFIVWVLRDHLRQELFIKLTALLISFWAFDALLQYLTGYNILGFEPLNNRLTGIFSRAGYGLGPYLAILGIMVMFYLANPYYKVSPKQFLLMLSLSALLFVVVILTGVRSSWFMLTIGFSVYFLTLFYFSNKKTKTIIISLFFSGLILLWSMYQFNASVHSRINQTLLLFEADEALIDKALSHRLDIWKVSLDVIEDHYVNGIGARGYRYIFSSYAGSENFYIQKDKIPAHPHGILPEIMTETGVIGIVGYMLLLYFLYYAWRQAGDRKKRAYPLAVVVLIITFPLNVHWAVYSSAWGQVFIYLIALYIAYVALPVSNHEILNDEIRQ